MEERPPSPELERLGRVAERLHAVLAVDGFEDLARAAAGEADRLRAERCEVSIVGEFKRGKSTLVNAVIGADLVPVGALPLTAVATLVEYGPEIACTVDLNDGTRLAIEPSKIERYATERGEKVRSRSVARVHLAAPSSALAGLRIVDTPGIESVYGEASAVAREVLASADAVVVVLGADQPVSRREQELVREVARLERPTIVVVNRVDLVLAEEREGLVRFVRDVVSGAGGARRIPVIAVSAHAARQAQRRADAPALEASGLHALEEALRALAGSVGRHAVAAAARVRLDRLIDEALARQYLRGRAPDLLRDRRDDRRTWLEQQVNAVMLKLTLDGSRLLQARAVEIRTKLSESSGRLAEVLRQPPLDGAASEATSPHDFAATIASRLHDALAHQLARWSVYEEGMLSIVAKEVAEAECSRAIELSGTFGVPAGEPSMIPTERPSLEFSLPVVPLERGALLPGSLGRRQVLRRRRRWLRENLERLRRERHAAACHAVEAWLRSLEDRSHRRLRKIAGAICGPTAGSTWHPAHYDEELPSELQRLRIELSRGNDDTATPSTRDEAV